VLEDNLAVRRLLESVGAPYALAVHRRYRIYEAPLRACEETLHKL
jgi:hypothetical protein